MPILSITIANSLSKRQERTISSELSKIVSRVTGNSEESLSITCQDYKDYLDKEMLRFFARDYSDIG